MMRKYLTGLFVLLATTTYYNTLRAQNQEHGMGIEVNGGYREYLGDLGSSLFFGKKPNYQGFGLNFGKQINSFLDGVVNFSTGDVGYYSTIEWKTAPQKYAGFRANTLDLCLGARFYPLGLKGNFPKVNPYLYGGFGGYYVHSRINNRSSNLTDMGANVQGGFGISFNLTPSFGLRWSWTLNYTMNDIWDGENHDPYNQLTHGIWRTNDAYSHHALGLTYAFGSGPGTIIPKDNDKDGVWDKFDLCKGTPEKYIGFVDSVGCPADTDKDSILDADDPCPKAWGPRKFNGCPDTDNDGIQDKDDACPTVAGLEKFKGCPDTDGDGIQDSEDECPTVAGLEAFKGCPDTDGDGIEDRKDKCKEIKGDAEGEGCPDTDGDGIYDNIDKCKFVKGVPENKGCPVIETRIAERIKLAAKGIQFESGKDVIKPVSFGNLDTLASIMNRYKEATVDIEGHTDNTGVKDSNQRKVNNLDLSQKRADAVKKYLADKGVEVTRMTAVGYGESRPKATNATPAGRQTNRRVDFNLKY